MSILYVGIDLAKNVFAVHGVNALGGAELRQPKVARAKLLTLIASLPQCVIGIEACSGAHHWARLIQTHGHTVRLMAPIKSMARDCTLAQRLMQLKGVGETTSTALVVMIGNAKDFDNGRQLAPWLGLVPGNTARAARPGSGGSRRQATPASAACSYSAPARCSMPLRTRPTRSAAGRCRCASAGATGRR